MIRKTLSLVAMATTLHGLAGCGQASGMASMLSTGSLASYNLAGNATAGADATNDGPGRGGRGGRRGGPGGHGGPGGLFGLDLASLNLTVDQQAQLKALLDKHRPSAPPSADANNPHKAIQDAVLATTVDDATLRAALAAEQADRANHQPPAPAGLLAGLYGMLTADQRAQVVAALQAQPVPSPRPTPSDDPRAKLEASLNLTADQQAKLAALDAAMKPPAPPADRRAQLIAFWQSGDASVIAAPTPPAFPTDVFVAAVESLDLSQRQALFARGTNGSGGPGGPGGPGDFDGPYGRGGHVGPDGQPPAAAAPSDAATQAP